MNYKTCCRDILHNIGPTLLGIKPAELRNIPLLDDSGEDCWLRCKEIVLSSNQIRLMELRELSGKIQVLFYHPLALDRQLSKSYNLCFLQQLDYPRTYTLAGYLNYLLIRIQKSEFPHEIGIFLGYPLKDVLGFTGYLDLKRTGKGSWKFYGNRTVSAICQNKFRLAQRVVDNRLQELNQIEDFYQVVEFN
ncbi:DUF3793 family protein [Halanaerocella petrolearia]